MPRHQACRQQSTALSQRRKRLDLLSTPTLVRLAHVGGRLDGGDELQHHVGNTSDADDRGGDLAEDVAVQNDAANEDIDWRGKNQLATTAGIGFDSNNLQTPRPRKENRKEA